MFSCHVLLFSNWNINSEWYRFSKDCEPLIVFSGGILHHFKFSQLFSMFKGDKLFDISRHVNYFVIWLSYCTFSYGCHFHTTIWFFLIITLFLFWKTIKLKMNCQRKWKPESVQVAKHKQVELLQKAFFFYFFRLDYTPNFRRAGSRNFLSVIHW